MGDIYLEMEVGREAGIDCPGIERDLHLCLTVPLCLISFMAEFLFSPPLASLFLSSLACPYPDLAAAVWEGNGCPVVKRSEG